MPEILKAAGGPRTEAGKARASRNAVKHGILARKEDLVAGEKAAVFRGLVAGLRQEWRPETATESVLVDRIAMCMWRLRRAASAERELAERQEAPGRAFASWAGVTARTILRYEVAMERSLYRAIAALSELKRARREAAAEEREEAERRAKRARLAPVRE